MSEPVVCPHCQAGYKNVPEKLRGRRVACRRCGQEFLVPLPAGPAPTVLASPASTAPAPTVLDASQTASVYQTPEWSPGQVLLDLYEVIELLGEGGMGRVYRVRHREWGLDLAVKTPKAEALRAAGGAANFEREAETWVNLGLHPHTVSCYYVRPLDGLPSVFAEYVSGGSLHDWIAGDGRRPGRLYRGRPREALVRLLDIGIQFAWGLDYAHAQGLVHCDVKPANVLITQEGLAKVTDFGLASASSTGADQEAAQGPRPGTPQYFAPEQAAGGEVGPQADLWAWALCLVEMFNGGRTWESGTVAEAVLGELKKSGSFRPGPPPLPGPLAAFLQRCFRTDPAARPAGLSEAASYLARLYAKVAGRDYPRRTPKAGRADPGSLNNHAVSLLDLGRVDEARKLWGQALRADPHHPEATYNRGLDLWRSTGQTDQALIAQLIEAARSEPAPGRCHFLLSLVHLERDDCDGATRLLEKLGDQRPETLEAIKSAAARRPSSNRLLRTFRGLESGAAAVALTPDAKFFLTAGDDPKLMVWETKTGRPMKTIDLRAPVSRLALDESASLVLTGGGDYASRDYSLTLWDLDRGEPLRRLTGHQGPVYALDLAPDGGLAVSGGEDRTLRLYNTADSLVRHVWRTESAVWAAAIHAGRGLVYAGGADGNITIWNTETGRNTGRLEGHTGRVTSLALSADGQRLLSGGSDNLALVWDLENETPRRLTGHRDEVTAVFLSPDGKYAVTAGYDGALRLWEADSGRCRRTFEGHESWVLSLAGSRDGRFILSGGLDRTVRLWKADGRSRSFRAAPALCRVATSEAVSRAEQEYGRHLARAGKAMERGDYARAAEAVRRARAQEGYARTAEGLELWARLYLHLPRTGLAGGWEDRVFTAPGGLGPAGFDHRGDRILAGTGDGRLLAWSVPSGEQCLKVDRHEGPVVAAGFSPDGRWILSAGRDRTIYLSDAETGRGLRFFDAGESRTQTAVVSPDGRLALSGHEDGRIRLWDLEAGIPAGVLTGHLTAVNSLDFSPDGRLALSGGGDHTGEHSEVRLWDVSTRKCLSVMTGPERAVNAVRLSPDGDRAVSGSSDGDILLWRAAEGRKLGRIGDRQAPVLSLALGRDGRTLVSGDFDGGLKLWDIASGRLLRSFKGHSGPVTSVSLSPTGRYILSVGRDGRARLWALDWELGDPPERIRDESVRPGIDGRGAD